MDIESRLHELGISLPSDVAAAARYTPAVIHDNLAYISGQLPRESNTVYVVGKVGRDISADEAKRASRIAFIRTLAALHDALGNLDRLEQVLRLVVYVNSDDDFTDFSRVADGASEVIFDLLGPQKGQHSRTSIGGIKLPRNAAVEIEVTFALYPVG
ncbi:RidA family protein [Agrobacterium vitis]|uniref:RidA family protein n=1 Tax=Agrobacterium vitis TaxID=373 RepID=UPI000872DA33|nr:RidA family protein [Agrobacterium vitis]MCE6078509.1 RidA family protein [Agrobacterium vitis]MCF1455918.1 RidA family protein [Agrobacterium vitis]MCF1470238.1 RidA family protein [Agrobacterium vitis]MCM2453594.1 RidA family protein [Agrobacterium vitis]MUO73494.1 RidA family protein [Agrobacterium vitis]